MALGWAQVFWEGRVLAFQIEISFQQPRFTPLFVKGDLRDRARRRTKYLQYLLVRCSVGNVGMNPQVPDKRKPLVGCFMEPHSNIPCCRIRIFREPARDQSKPRHQRARTGGQPATTTPGSVMRVCTHQLRPRKPPLTPHMSPRPCLL